MCMLQQQQQNKKTKHSNALLILDKSLVHICLNSTYNKFINIKNWNQTNKNNITTYDAQHQSCGKQS